MEIKSLLSVLDGSAEMDLEDVQDLIVDFLQERNLRLEQYTKLEKFMEASQKITKELNERINILDRERSAAHKQAYDTGTDLINAQAKVAELTAKLGQADEKIAELHEIAETAKRARMDAETLLRQARAELEKSERPPRDAIDL